MHLFEPLPQRGVTFRNRIAVSPMCQYSSEDGFANDWHLVHLGSRAVGGAGAVLTEVTAVEDRGRISPQDLGIWKDEHVEFLSRITRFVREQGAVAGMQIGHAGRKASTRRPWEGYGWVPPEEGGWQPVAPSALAFDDEHPVPDALTIDDIRGVVRSFRDAARRALDAGFELIELHGAHGYLGHQFLSPLSNHRDDAYGGSPENRRRFLVEVADAVREVWPERLPLWVRLSAVDYVDGGLTIEDTIETARVLKDHGIDLVDVSTGGNVPARPPAIGPGYQVQYAAAVRRGAGIATGAVGLISSPEQADTIVRTGQADVVLLARELLRDPYFPLRAGRVLRQEAPWPAQYLRAK